jgi:uncharacterized Zn-binding protein involved in type VI secretion
MPDDDPKSGGGADAGQGAFGGDEKKKKEESGLQPKGTQSSSQNFGQKEKGVGEDATPEGDKSGGEKKGPKSSTKVTVWKKELVKEQQGFLGPHKGDPADEKDSNSIGVGYYKAGIKSELSFDLKKKEGELTVVNAEGQFSVVHGQAKGEWNVGDLIRGIVGAIPGSPGGGPMAARVGDSTAHGSPLSPGIGSTDVMIGNMPAWRAQIDFHACPIVKGLIPDVGGMVMFGSPTVMIDFMMACRMGDMVVEIPGGPNPIVVGCPTVMIGSAGSGSGGSGSGGDAKSGGGPTVSGEASGDIGVVKAEVKAGVLVDKNHAQVEAKAGAMAAVAQGELKGGLTIPLWGDHSISLGASVQGSVLSAGAEAHADAGWSKEKGWHAGAGAKAGVGWAGAGAGFSIGFK